MYRDTSYDTPGGELLDGDRELRIREIEGADGSRPLRDPRPGPRVPGLDGVYLEVETAAEGSGELAPALDVVRGLMAELGIEEGDFTTGLYTDAVAARRGSDGRAAALRAAVLGTAVLRAVGASGGRAPGVVRSRERRASRRLGVDEQLC
ncbi:hypothetical protein [Kitasatospora sp. NPDC057936]|uniref:hypothetical protein n=1 Tax=Kitasatospora sp. NPDC057936 TaxID=3346283 RepID=UPI0036DD177D